MKIKNIHAREILDSRGIPTISTEIELWSGDKGVSEVPSGSSTGKTEVFELRDNDPSRHNGNGVLKAVETINGKIKELVVDKEFTSQKEFDDLLNSTDGTELKSNLGGNTILSCSMAFARAVTNSLGLNLYEYLAMIYWDKEYKESNFKLPTPMVLVMEGGKHGNWATDIQEYMIVPNMEKFKSFSEAFKSSTEVFHNIHDILDERGYSVGLGLEGGYAPKELTGNEEAFEIIMEGIGKAEFKIGDDFKFALDLASSEFFNEESKKYVLKSEKKELSTEEWVALQKEWYKKYPVYSIEDPLNQDDWSGWASLTEELGKDLVIIGDDLLTTNVKRIQNGIDTKAMNSVLIKLNQIGSVTETLNAIRISTDNGLSSVISHRSGETNDNFIADLVIATPSDFCKFGAPSRGERLVKYNRLLEIEEILKR